MSRALSERRKLSSVFQTVFLHTPKPDLLFHHNACVNHQPRFGGSHKTTLLVCNGLSAVLHTRVGPPVCCVPFVNSLSNGRRLYTGTLMPRAGTPTAALVPSTWLRVRRFLYNRPFQRYAAGLLEHFSARRSPRLLGLRRKEEFASETFDRSCMSVEI